MCEAGSGESVDDWLGDWDGIGKPTMGSPSPAATAEPLAEEDQVVGAFWALLERASYAVW